tara:strand:- start:1472 stop:2800 length:1329 start_codon:yes stop_codon:yes gene_type:complete
VNFKIYIILVCLIFYPQLGSTDELAYQTIDEYDKFEELDFYEHIRNIVIVQPEFIESVSKQNEINEDRKFASRSRFPSITASLINDKSLKRDVDDFLSLRKRQDDSFDGVITVDQPLYLGNKINSQVNIAKAKLKKSKEELNEVASNLIVNAVEIYLTALKSDIISTFAENELIKLLVFKDQVNARFQAGAADSSEKALVNVRLSELEANEAILKSKKIQNLAVYEAFFKKPFENLGLPKIKLNNVLESNIYNAFVGMSYQEKIAKIEIESQESHVELTKSSYRPQLGMSFRFTKYDIDDNEIKDEDLRGGIYFSVPLINFGRASAEINSAKARLNQSKILYSQSSRDSDYQKASVLGNIIGLNEARKKILSSLDNIRLQKETLQLRLSSGANFTAIALIDATVQEIDLLNQLLDTEQSLLISELQANHLNTNLIQRFKISF